MDQQKLLARLSLPKDEVIFIGYIHKGIYAFGDDKDYFVMECKINGAYAHAVTLLQQNRDTESLVFLMNSSVKACASNILKQIEDKIDGEEKN